MSAGNNAKILQRVESSHVMLDSDHDLLTMLLSELAAAYVTSYDDF